ncbi:MAG: glycosyltransferase [Nitrospirota bacterium]
MKILQVNTEYARGGAAQVALRLHNSLKEMPGIESRFAYGRGGRSQDPDSFYFGLIPEVYLHALTARITSLQGYGSWLSTIRLIKYVKKEKFDLIHLHNLHGYYLSNGFVEFLKEAGLPVVWTLHDGWPVTGRCPYLSDCKKWRNGCGDCSDLRDYPRSFIVDMSALMLRIKKRAFSVGWNPCLISPSKWLASDIRQSYLSRHEIRVIQNGLDVNLFRPADKTAAKVKLGIPPDKKAILLLSADLKDKRKGARYFFEALQYMDYKKPSVILVGKKVDIPASLTSKYGIRQLGYLSSREALMDAYNAADIFCATYLNDNFPNTVLESMACGTPIVGFASGGVIEQVTEGCGILVPPRDSEALGRAIGTLLNEENLLRKMGAAAREKALREYSIETFVNKHVDLYKELLHPQGKKKIN